LAQERLKGTAHEHLNDVPNAFIQKQAGNFMVALNTNLEIFGTETKFEIKRKKRNGTGDSVTFNGRNWDHGKIWPTYFEDPFFSFGNGHPTPKVEKIYFLI
jgi:hypothetical protein